MKVKKCSLMNAIFWNEIYFKEEDTCIVFFLIENNTKKDC